MIHPKPPCPRRDPLGRWALARPFGWLLVLIVMAGLGAGQSSSAEEADLVALELQFSPGTLDPSAHPTTVTYQFGNYGPDDLLADDVVTELFLSRNTVLGDADDVRIWWSEDFVYYLEAGYAMEVPLDAAALAQVTIPADASGSYYVYVRVRHASSSSYYDPDLSDNKTRRIGTITVTAPAPPKLGWTIVPAQGFQLSINGLAGRSYRFDGSTNLIDWEPLSTVPADGTGAAQYLDGAATNLNYRFYRAALLPP